MRKLKHGDEIIKDNNSEISSAEKISKILDNITDEILNKNEDNIFEPSTTIFQKNAKKSTLLRVGWIAQI